MELMHGHIKTLYLCGHTGLQQKLSDIFTGGGEKSK